MSTNKAIAGLCQTCRNCAECTFPRISERPVWQCEEFAGVESNLERHSFEGTLPGRTGLITEEESGAWSGLCKTCDNRKICSFPKLEGGVWHCEEYV